MVMTFDARTNVSRPFGQQLREARRLVGQAARLAWRASPHLVLGIVVLLALQALLSALQLALSRALIDSAAAALQLAAVRDPLAARLPLAAWIALAAAGVAAGQLIQPFVEAFQNLAGDRLTAYVTEQIIRAANRWQGLARFENPGFFDDLERARRHASQAGLNVVVFVTRSILSLFTVAGLALILLALHPLAPMLIILATIPQMARQFEYRHLTSTHLYIQTPEARRLDYSRTTLLTPEPAKDVRLYGLGPFFRRRYDLSFERATATLSRLRRRLMAPMALATALSATAVGAAYVYVVWLIAHGQRSLGDLALYGGAATLLHMTLLSLGFDITSTPMGLGVFLPSLFRVLDAPPDLPLPRNPRHAPRPIRQGIVFDHVAFTYAGHDVPVLRDVSFCIRPDECVALVGRNGAGKTTIVKLLLRLYDPTAGRILLDGVDLRDYDLDDLRREMGVIFQDFVRYEMTAGENIALGRVEALHDRVQVHSAAARAGADDLIEHLPQGLDTPLGRQFADRDLSGGEWQKLALARAFMRDGQLLVLDEPTAALDVQTEHDVYTRFHDLTRDRMTLLVSHRFSTVRMADRILYLADGNVQEEGSHADLIARDGAYARLYSLQAAQYLDDAGRDLMEGHVSTIQP